MFQRSSLCSKILLNSWGVVKVKICKSNWCLKLGFYGLPSYRNMNPSNLDWPAFNLVLSLDQTKRKENPGKCTFWQSQINLAIYFNLNLAKSRKTKKYLSTLLQYLPHISKATVKSEIFAFEISALHDLFLCRPKPAFWIFYFL